MISLVNKVARPLLFFIGISLYASRKREAYIHRPRISGSEGGWVIVAQSKYLLPSG